MKKKDEEIATRSGNFANHARSDPGTSNQALASIRKSHSKWILHSGASMHVTGSSSEFVSYTSYPHAHIQKMAQTADGTAQPIRGTGVVKCTPIKLHYLRFYMSLLFSSTWSQ